MWRWCKRCSWLGIRHGFWPPDWRNTLRGFTTRRRIRWRAWDSNVRGTNRGCTHPLGGLWKWWSWRRSGYISPDERTRSRNTLWPVLLWNCVLRRSGIRECAYPGNGGSSPPWISWGWGRGRHTWRRGIRQGGNTWRPRERYIRVGAYDREGMIW